MQTRRGHGGVQGFPAPAVEADDPGLVPAHLEAGRGGLDRGEIGVQHHVIGTQEPHRQGTDAESFREVFPPRREDNHAAVYGQVCQWPVAGSFPRTIFWAGWSGK